MAYAQEVFVFPSPERLARMAQPGPRYTSYPTAPMWRPTVTEEVRREALARLDGPVSVYVHVPFCREQCWFCGCNMVVAGRRAAGERYLDGLERYVDELVLSTRRIDASRLHLGGGTPTWLDERQLERLFEIVRRRFRTVEGSEISVELDPEITTDGQIDLLVELGVNRLSMGVQSFDPEVLSAVNRPQEANGVIRIARAARDRGIGSLNIDLMYGLPHQDLASFVDTLERTLALGPERLAVFGYAHVPWMKRHQRRFGDATLPGPVERAAQALLAYQLLTEAGYQAIGMDHFALPDDELAVAYRERRLHRNFMGYTTHRGMPLVGLGMSAISELGDLYVQDLTRLSRWWKAVESGKPVLERGLRTTPEDRLRRDVIHALMCNFEVRFDEVEMEHGIVFRTWFADELERLGPLEEEGLVVRGEDRIVVTPIGRWVVRNVAMVFDAWLDSRESGGPGFSRTV